MNIPKERSLYFHPVGHKPMIDDQLVCYGIEMTSLDSSGELPLHLAVKYQVPIRIIEIIICAFPRTFIPRRIVTL